MTEWFWHAKNYLVKLKSFGIEKTPSPSHVGKNSQIILYFFWVLPLFLLSWVIILMVWSHKSDVWPLICCQGRTLFRWSCIDGPPSHIRLLSLHLLDRLCHPSWWWTFKHSNQKLSRQGNLWHSHIPITAAWSRCGNLVSTIQSHLIIKVKIVFRKVLDISHGVLLQLR